MTRQPSLTRFFRHVVVVLCLFSGFSLAESQIAEVSIRGNKRIETAAIRSRLKSQVGAALNADTVREDIRSVFGLGYFENVEAFEESVAGGTRLVFEVKEKPIVTKIEYEGLDAIEKDDLKDIVLLREFEVLDIAKLKNSVEKLLQKYEEKGFFLAEVRYEVVPDEQRSEATVIFKIEENDKVQVKSINIIGNKIVSDDELKEIMQTKEGGFFSFMTGSGAYREAVFERDLALLSYYYGTQGYVRARFGKPEVSVSPDKRGIYLTFSVDEGNQYTVGKIDFSGDLLYSRQELKDDLNLVTGEVFNTDLLRRETLRYTEKYSDLGYAFANVVPQHIINDETRTVDITFEVERGERVYIGKILITGNTRTKDKVVRRELLIHEGELFNGTKKRESRENVMRLGFFDNVEFHQSTSKVAPNVVDIEIKVKERSTGQLVVGAGYGSNNGFTFTAQLSQNNFLGNGQMAALSLNILTGSNYYAGNLSFQEPYLGASLWSLGGDFYRNQRELLMPNLGVITYKETKTGVRVNLGHPVLEFTNLYFSYNVERSDAPVDSIIDQTLIRPEHVNGLTSAVTANFVVDKRDDRFSPSNGWYFNLTGEYAGLGGDRFYQKLKTGVRFFKPFFSDFVFRFNLGAGNISPLGGQPVPINELFLQGGLMTLRGYPINSVGPTRRLSDDINNLSPKAQELEKTGKPEHKYTGREIVYGGHNEVLMNFEMEFPLLREARIRGVVFFDAGNAFDGLFDTRGRGVPALLTNFGWGFRWFTPIGPLRFEFGYPIVGGGEPQFWFSIGPPF